MEQTQPRQRLASLDALRGFDMIWILGAEGLFSAFYVLSGWSLWQVLGHQFQHSNWHGFTFYDLIFPLFIFISGVTLGLANKSLRGVAFEKRKTVYKKAFLRLFLLCILGVVYNHGWGQGIPADPEKIRYASVLMRIGVAWFFCAMILWHFNRNTQLIIAVTILFGYWMLLSFIPTPEGVMGKLTMQDSWNSWIDRNLLPGVRYRDLATDPEGILSHFPAIVNALAGAFVGQFMSGLMADKYKRTGYLLIAALGCLLVGHLWGIIFPINKTLWTSSFVLVSVGWSIFLFALFYFCIDVLNWRLPIKLFSAIGLNAILLYLLSSLMSWQYLVNSLFGGVISSLSSSMQPLIVVLVLVALQWGLAQLLLKYKLFIKV